MKKYLDPENDRYRFLVRKTLNGFSIEVLVVPTGEIVGLTRNVASQLLISLPDDYRIQSGTLEAAEAHLDRLASLNGWTAIE